jgi:hypothetical protein|nr:hypothetical protein [Neorhizobium tomejilense]
MDLKIATSPPATQRRLHILPDRFLARALLGLCRKARNVHAVLAKTPRTGSDHGVFLVWDIGPEIAARLGETEFSHQERRSVVRSASVGDLRSWTWNALERTAPLPHSSHDGSDPWNVLRTDVADGNPLFIALDRLSPPHTFDAFADPASARVATAFLARGLPPVLSWRPDVKKPPDGKTFRWLSDGVFGVS